MNDADAADFYAKPENQRPAGPPRRRHGYVAVRCATCGVARPVSDMGRINDRWFCHTATSVDDTCYMREDQRLTVEAMMPLQWEAMALLDEDDE